MNYFVNTYYNFEETMVHKCLICGNNDIRVAEISSMGGQGPDLLPGTGFFTHAKFSMGVCSACGYVHWFVREEDLEKVKNSKKFNSKFDIYRPK
jgi:predicted nucleic-acid-binding Zn-ribbon protein